MSTRIPNPDGSYDMQDDSERSHDSTNPADAPSSGRGMSASDGWPPPEEKVPSTCPPGLAERMYDPPSDSSPSDIRQPHTGAKYDPAPMPPAGPFGVKDATASVVAVCDEAKLFIVQIKPVVTEIGKTILGMAQDVRSSAWWKILTKQDQTKGEEPTTTRPGGPTIVFPPMKEVT